MKRRNDGERGISVATLHARWPVSGVHGQRIGYVDACGIDLDSGRIAYVVLVTPSQTIEIPWERVRPDGVQRRLRLLPPARE